MNQGLGDSHNDPLCLDLDFPMDETNFDTIDTPGLALLPPSDFITAGAVAVARRYTSEAQGFPFNPPTTLGTTSSHYIPPPSDDIFNPHHPKTDFTTATTAGQGFNPVLPDTGEARAPPRRYRKVETHDKRIIRQQSGTRQVDHRSTAIDVPSLDRPQGMSKDEHVKLLRARLAEYDTMPQHFDQ